MRSSVPAIPSVSSIKDTDTRLVLQAVIDTLRVRNGDVGTGDHRFLTPADIEKGIQNTQINWGASGGVGLVHMSGASKPNPVTKIVEDLVKKASDEIQKSKIWQELGGRVAKIERPAWFAEQFGSAIKSEELKRDSADKALISRLDTVVASYGENFAAVTQELAAQATATSANASAITSLTTTVGGVSSTASQALSLSQSNNGVITGGYSVKFDVNGYVTGFGLGVDSSSGSASSTFVVRADRFSVGSPGATAVNPFTVSGGNVYINNAIIGSGNYRIGVSSLNYVQGSSGWSLDATTGSAQFSGLTVTQTIQAYAYNGSYGWSLTNAGDFNTRNIVVRSALQVQNGASVTGNLGVSGSITLNGSTITSWPSGGGGGSYPSSASFSSVTMNGSITSGGGSGSSYGWTIDYAGHARFAGGVTAYGGFANFTGVHYGVVEAGAATSWEVGDVLVDVSVVYSSGVSNVTFCVAPSSTLSDPRVIGVVQKVESGVDAADLPELFSVGYDLVRINAVGEGQINVCGAGGDIAPGDLLVSSLMPGKAMRQADDLVRNCTVAKARQGCSFSTPSETNTIACVYLCG